MHYSGVSAEERPERWKDGSWHRLLLPPFTSQSQPSIFNRLSPSRLFPGRYCANRIGRRVIRKNLSTAIGREIDASVLARERKMCSLPLAIKYLIRTTGHHLSIRKFSLEAGISHRTSVLWGSTCQPCPDSTSKLVLSISEHKRDAICIRLRSQHPHFAVYCLRPWA